MSRNPNLGQFHNVTANKSPEKTNGVRVCMKNDKQRIQDELKDKIDERNPCPHSEQII